MKIGILTYHKSHNYGALLQAIALRNVLERMGHEAYFVDYWPDYHKGMYKFFNLQDFLNGSLRGKARILKDFITCFPLKLKRIKKFKKFIRKNIDPYLIPYSDSVFLDATIYGSDQIWRKQSRFGNRFNPVYFADNLLNTKKHISYAASMGILHKDEESVRFLKDHLSRFDSISVRESDLANLIIQKTGYKAEIVLDPTLLLTSKEWDQLIPTKEVKRKPYLLYYSLMYGSFDLEAVKRYAKDKGLELLILKGMGQHWFEKKNQLETVDSAEFIELIRNAEVVVTSSFHGLVFALNYNKPVIASFRENSNRAESILHAVGLDECLIPPMSPMLPNVSANWEDVNQRMNDLKKSSFNFLEESLAMETLNPIES